MPPASPEKQPSHLERADLVPRKVGWAVVGLGELAVKEILPAFGQCRMARPTALVSGRPDQAARLATVYGIAPDAIYGYADFDRIAGDSRIDVVYVVLPNSMHAEYTMRALRAGKHVLCEKPMATSVADCERMIAAAGDARRKLMIGYRLHYEPLNQKVMQLCRDRALGPIKTIVSSNCQNVQAPDIRLRSELGGGPLGDLGVYSINAARYVTGEEPVEVLAFARQPPDDPRFKEVPESVSFLLRYPSGVVAACDCSFGAATSRHYRVHCTDGYIEMDPAFAYGGLKLSVKRGDESQGDASVAEMLIEQVNHFAAEMDHFSECVIANKEPDTPGEMGLADQRIMAAIEQAARSGRPARLG